jgi:hypothetical protein
MIFDISFVGDERRFDLTVQRGPALLRDDLKREQSVNLSMEVFLKGKAQYG